MSVVLPDVSALQAIVRWRQIDRARALWASRAAWPEAVAAEVPQRLRPQFEWLGEPIEITHARHIAEVDRIRRAVFGGVRGRPTDHLAEAQLMFLMRHDDLVADAVWVTADSSILDMANRRSMPCLRLQSELGLS